VAATTLASSNLAKSKVRQFPYYGNNLPTLALKASLMPSGDFNSLLEKKNNKRKAATTLEKVSPVKVPKKEDPPTIAQPEESTQMDSVIASKAENTSMQQV
jgi:hypothetical protein